MPTRPEMPDLPAKQQVEKIEEKIDRERTRAVFINLLGAMLVAHFLLTMLITGDGLLGYFMSWQQVGYFLLHNPMAGAAVPLALWGLYKGVDLWRHPEPEEVELPEYDEIPDLRWENEIYVGSAHTRDGKQPGEMLESDDEVMEEEDQHVILTEKGLFGNIHVKGGVGGGKTSTLIMPFMDQGIAKFPRPPEPDEFPLGPDGRYQMLGGPREDTRSPFEKAFDSLRVQDGRERYDHLPYDQRWNPYLGMTPEEAEDVYRDLLEQHEQHKWGMFVIDPKGDLTDYVQRSAKMSGREDDVIVLEPGGEHTYNPLAISHNPLVQAEMVMDGIEAVSGEGVPHYWRSTQSEWLANALEILRVVEPTRVNFETILKMARNEAQRIRWVAEAEAVMMQAREEEEQLRRVGKDYDGIRVNPAAIEFFRDWDDEDTDPKQKQAVVSGIKSQSKFFVDAAIAPFLCPQMPPTFPGFDTMIDQGKIVCLRMPLSEYGPVAKVLGILMLADAQQAARERITTPEWNQDRVVAFVVDEISAYLNRLTKDFVAMNRQSRVTFLAAHQSQGQLVQHHDRGYEQSFNDNLRTKISYSAPNADAANKEVRIYGARKVFKEVWSEGTTFGDVTREAASESIKPGRESQGATRRIEEVQRSWFEAEDFMALELGECIVMAFDGEATRPPRKVRAPRYWLMERNQIAAELNLDDPLPAPHPVVRIEEPGRRFQYFVSAVSHSGYTIVEPLADEDGALAGFCFVTSIGTVIVPIHVLEESRELVVERLGDPQKLIGLTDLRAPAVFLDDMLGVIFERALDLPGAYRRFHEDAPSGDFYDLVTHATGHELPYPRKGAWEYHWDEFDQHRESILEDSLATARFFKAVGSEVHELSPREIEHIYQETLRALERALSDDYAAPVTITEDAPDADGEEDGPDDDPGGAPTSPPAPDAGPDAGGDETDPGDLEDAAQPPSEGSSAPDEDAPQESADRELGEDGEGADTPPPPETFDGFDPPETGFEEPDWAPAPSFDEPEEIEYDDADIPDFGPPEGFEVPEAEEGYLPFDDQGDDPFAADSFPDELADGEPTIDALPSEDDLDNEGSSEAPEDSEPQDAPDPTSLEPEEATEDGDSDLRYSEETAWLPGFEETPSEEGVHLEGGAPEGRDLRFPEASPGGDATPPDPPPVSSEPPSSSSPPHSDESAPEAPRPSSDTDQDGSTSGSGRPSGDGDAGPARDSAGEDDAPEALDDGHPQDGRARRSRGARRSPRDLDDTDFTDGAPDR